MVMVQDDPCVFNVQIENIKCPANIRETSPLSIRYENTTSDSHRHTWDGIVRDRLARHLVAAHRNITKVNILREISDISRVKDYVLVSVEFRSYEACHQSPRKGKYFHGLLIASMKLYSIALRCLQRGFPVESQRTLGAVNLEHLKPEVVLSENNRKSFIERLKTHKPAKKLDEKVNRAAVLVPLCKHKGELGFLYTLRSTKVTSNRGQVSFPGGMYDKEDHSLQETALRETWEELRIPKEKVDVWTCGNLIDKTNVQVMPVFGYIGDVDPDKLDINTDEVEEAFFLSLKNLCDPSLCRFTQFRDNYTLPVYLGGKHRIWGFTAATTHMILHALVPDVYKHKLVYLKPILPKIKDTLKNDIHSS
ncbi:uncharacterized protein LOC128878066 [Hylaeus volcanicus]|uniref:uncharacterized protein LOC128878066 n=1 Tax=Hylaeus volcanicus TaxID=313075 RepID=UPI0023B84F37|nr:uncharacterized protein LOC128878066 [Hylaeus volcanicus]